MTLITDLINVIGLSQRGCDCYGSQPGAWATLNESKSGLYVDNLQYGPDLSIPIVPDDCENSDVYDLLENARTQGLNDLLTHFMGEMDKQARGDVNGHSGTIGENERTTVAKSGISGNFAALVVYPNSYKGISFHIDAIGLKMQTPDTYTITVYDLDDLTTALETFTVTATANTLTNASLSGKVVDFAFYAKHKRKTLVFVYDRLGYLPHEISTYCGCNYDAQWVKKNLIQTSGVTVDAVNDLEHSYYRNSETYGLVIDFELKCAGMEWLTEKDDDFWSGTSFGRNFATMFQFYSCIALISTIIDSANISSYTSMNFEALAMKRQSLRKNVNEIVPWLVQRMPEDVTDCYVCRPAHNITRNELLI